MSSDPVRAASEHEAALKRIRIHNDREKTRINSMWAEGGGVLVIIVVWLAMATALARVELKVEVAIRARQAHVWTHVSNMGAWEGFNEAFAVYGPKGNLQVGSPIRITPHWRDERITVIEPPARMCWDSEATPVIPYVPHLLLGTERCITLAQASPHVTNVTSYERLSGPLGVAVGLWMGGTIKEGFSRHLLGLKRKCERRPWYLWS